MMTSSRSVAIPAFAADAGKPASAAVIEWI
jgi:hypothetical protein